MIEILFQDEHICVVNKPPGHAVHRSRGTKNSPILMQELRDQIGALVYPVHRLDGGTSGCIAFALSSVMATKLQAELTLGGAIKRYLALCRGHLPSEGKFDRDLSNDNKVKQTALTEFRVVKEFKDFSLLDLRILTGRKHQIRRHLAFAGHQIVGDVNHGKGWLNRRFRENFQFHRMFLHCHFLSFIHPSSGVKLNLHCPLDRELEHLLSQIEPYDPSTFIKL